MEQVNSTIRYSLKENKLPVPNAPAYVAQVRGYKMVTHEQLVNLMAKANTTVSRQDIIVVLDLLESAVKEQLLNGNNVVTNLFAARVSIQGGFEARNAEYENGVHKVKVNLSASAPSSPMTSSGSGEFPRDSLIFRPCVSRMMLVK